MKGIHDRDEILYVGIDCCTYPKWVWGNEYSHSASGNVYWVKTNFSHAIDNYNQQLQFPKS